jgi:hypothetical protein
MAMKNSDVAAASGKSQFLLALIVIVRCFHQICKMCSTTLASGLNDLIGFASQQSVLKVYRHRKLLLMPTEIRRQGAAIGSFIIINQLLSCREGIYLFILVVTIHEVGSFMENLNSSILTKLQSLLQNPISISFSYLYSKNTYSKTEIWRMICLSPYSC